MAETILQHWLFTRFALPFLLVFFIVFAILEKTKLLGSDKKQLNSLVAFIIGLIFITFTYPVEVVNNLVLFLTVALVVTFVGLILWGFLSGSDKVDLGKMKIPLMVVLLIAVVSGVLWATGVLTPLSDWLFKQEWSGFFWTNVFFLVVVAAAIAMALKTTSGKSS